MIVYSEHFSWDDYYEKLELRTFTKRLFLKDTAVPSLGLTQTVNQVRSVFTFGRLASSSSNLLLVNRGFFVFLPSVSAGICACALRLITTMAAELRACALRSGGVFPVVVVIPENYMTMIISTLFI